MITSSSTESVARFVWCKKRCKYQTTFETNMCSIHFLQFLRRFLVRKLPPTHIIPPKPINYIIYSRSICSSIYAYLRSTKKGPTDSITPGEAIRAGSKALVAVRKLHSHCSNPLVPKLTWYSTETPKSIVVSWLRSLLLVPVGNMSMTGKCPVTSCISCLGVLVVSYIVGVKLLSTSRQRHSCVFQEKHAWKRTEI